VIVGENVAKTSVKVYDLRLHSSSCLVEPVRQVLARHLIIQEKFKYRK